MLITLSLIGCIATTQEQPLDNRVTPTSAANEPTQTPNKPSPIEATRLPKETVAAATDIPEPTATNIPLPTSTSTPDALTTTPVEQQCIDSRLIQEDEAYLLQGLVLNNYSTAIRILGSEGLDKPVWSYQHPKVRFPPAALISPNGNWVALETFQAIDVEQDIYNLSMQVVNWASGESVSGQFDNLTLTRAITDGWVNDSQFAFALDDEEETLHWLIWSPFDNSQQMLTVEVPGIGLSLRRNFYGYPTLDPRLEFLAYVCELCEEAEYTIKSLVSDRSSWSIDLGTKPSGIYRDVVRWSPDGDHLAFVVDGERDINDQVWVFTREGQLLYKIILPDSLEGIGALSLTWSPDGQYLAFVWSRADSSGETIQTLSYISLADGSVTDVCVDMHNSHPVWSPDSSKIAFNRPINGEETGGFLSVVDLVAKDAVYMPHPDAFVLTHWVSLP
ncbi:MAG: PD40 domain-containing protein [Ardenticatenaceae bacterium]|nr:PD40 domain-containing protein [Ardenticatenaceae bacterium]